MLEFVSNVFDTWQSLLGLGALVLWAFDKIGDARGWKKVPVVPDWVFLSCGGFFLFLACFSVWNEERIERSKSEAQLAELASPHLSLSIEQIIVEKGRFEVGDGNMAPATMVTVIASIRNTGADSICDDWILSVSAGGISGESEAYGTNSANFMMPKFKISVRMNEDQQLTEKTVSNPISRGAAQRGYLQFMFASSAHDQLKQKSARFELRCTDVTGAIVATSRNWDPNTDSGQLKMRPGIDYETLPYPPDEHVEESSPPDK